MEAELSEMDTFFFFFLINIWHRSSNGGLKGVRRYQCLWRRCRSIQSSNLCHFNRSSLIKCVLKKTSFLLPQLVRFKVEPKKRIHVLKPRVAGWLVQFHQIELPNNPAERRSTACPRSPLSNADSNKSSKKKKNPSIHPSLPPPAIPRSPRHV